MSDGIGQKVARYLEKLPGKQEIIYRYINGEIEEVSPLRKLVEEAIENSEPVLTFESEVTPYGHFDNYIYVLGAVIVHKRRWIPSPGYGWEEEELKVKVMDDLPPLPGGDQPW